MMQLPKRLQSIDALRAWTMFLMIFVNDVDGVHRIPEWIKHAPEAADAMGFADTVFPAFLFIVGLSLPFAIFNRWTKGESNRQVVLHILGRTFALVAMGFLHVNMEYYDRVNALLPLPVWEILLTLSFFLIWMVYPESLSPKRRLFFKGLGYVLLAVLALLYKGKDAGVAVWLRPYWWGILGLIGQAYVVVALLFVLFHGRLKALFFLFLALLLINVLYHVIPIPWHIWGIGDGASATLVMAGVLASLLYRHCVRTDQSGKVFLFMGGAALVILLAGIGIRPYTQGISKIRATPAWVLICISISLVAFLLLIYVVDIKHHSWIYRWILPAGSNTLTCYLLPYILYPVYELLHFKFPYMLSNGIGGIIRSLVTAYIIICITGLLEKKEIRIKL